MSRQEVETILGPAGDYRTEPHQVYCAPLDSGAGVVSWMSDEGSLSLVFDDKGSVKLWVAGPPALRPSDTDFISWLKRQWHRWFPE